jgi:uncharacterized protein
MKVARHARQPRPAAAPAGPAERRIGWDALATFAHPDGAAASAWEIAKPAPGVIPNGKASMAMDSSSLYSWAAQQAIYAEGLQFLGYPYLAELAQRAEYRRPAETLAKEMTRKWLQIKSTGDGDQGAKQDKIKAIEAEFRRLNVRGVVKKAAELDGLFGRAQIYIDTGVGLEDRDEIQTPLALTSSKIGKGSLKRLTVVEPMWTYPSQYNATDPLAEDFFKPSTWFVMGSQVHASRLLTVIGRQVPDILKPAYAFGGLSLSQMAKPYVDNWLRTRQSVSDIISAFSVMVLSTDMATNLNAGAAQQLNARVQLFTQMRDNRGVFVVNKSTEELTNVSAPLGSLDSLQAQTQEHMSAVTGIPLSILLGITPSGLNASNEGEIRTFYQWVEAQQEGMLTPHVNYILQVVQLSLFGEIDHEITIAWEPLWSMSEKEKADVWKSKMEGHEIAERIGAVDSTEIRASIAGEEDSPYPSLDLTKVIVPPEPDDDDLLTPEGQGGGGQA